MASPATIDVYKFTGNEAFAASGDISGTLNFLATDSLTDQPGDQPIVVPTGVADTFSFENWIKFRVTVSPDNKVENFLLWMDGTFSDEGSNVICYVGQTSSGTTPVDASSLFVGATAVSGFDGANIETFTVSSKLSVRRNGVAASGMTTVGQSTDYIIMQLAVASGANQGDIASETINFSFDEN